MIPFLKKYQNELVEMNGKLYQIKIQLLEYHEIDNHVKIRLLDELLADKKAVDGLELMKVPENKSLEQFGICRYGGLDDKPDFDGEESNHEWFNCGRRGHCPGEGLVCKSMKAEFGLLSPRLIQYLGFIAQGKSDPEIADEMGVGINTVHNIRERAKISTGLSSKPALAAFAVQKNMI